MKPAQRLLQGIGLAGSPHRSWQERPGPGVWGGTVDSVRKWRMALAGLAWLSWAAVPVQATDDTAYARLLQAHVRPGTISGIRLNVVDYNRPG